MKITLLHPSRWRAKQARKTLDLWLSRAENPGKIQHVLSIDHDDDQIELYKLLFGDGKSEITVNHNSNVVDATNIARHLATGDIIIYLSDDFQCPDYWDRLIIKRYELHGSPDFWLLRVDDQLQKTTADVLTIPIITKKLMIRLGYFWHPMYKSMFVDQDLFYTCQINGWLYHAPEYKFPHLHYCNGGALNDRTYERSSKNWNEGMAIYKKRKQLNFPLK